MINKSPTSDFLPIDSNDISTDFKEITEIPTDVFNILLRAKKNGQCWILKGLKSKYRNNFIYQELLQKECNILSSLHYPAIVTVEGLEEVEGYGKCIVMEYIDGLTLGEWLNIPHSKKEKRQILEQLLKAVEYIHKKQVVHRDLKPENIMVTRNGQNIKLIDFGLADADSYAIFKQPAGTKGFISPEQESSRKADSRNDIYSIGSIISLMGMGWKYRKIIENCHKSINSRYADIKALKDAIALTRKWFRAVCLITVAFLLFGGISIAYYKWSGPRQVYDIVADFKVGNLRCTSWGGGLVSIKSAYDKDSCVEIPSTVTYEGMTYKIDEITFDAFRNYHKLRSAAFPVNKLHIMKGAFKGCKQLHRLYFRSTTPYLIGNQLWPTNITQVFDPFHFKHTVIYVPKGSLQTYRQSAWQKFDNIKEY